MESSHRWTFVRYFGTQQVPIGMPALTDGRWTTDNGPSQKLTLSTLCSGELKNTLNWVPRLEKGSRLTHVVAKSWNQNDWYLYMRVSLSLDLDLNYQTF